MQKNEQKNSIKITLFQNVRAKQPMGEVDFKDHFRTLFTSKEKLEEGRRLKLLAATDESAYKKAKESLPAFIVGGFGGRGTSGLRDFEPSIMFEVDHAENVNEIIESLKVWEYTYCAFPSVSGKGLRIIVKTDCTLENRDYYYNSISEQISTFLSIPLSTDDSTGTHIDTSTKDVCRIWFYSGIEPKDFYYNENSKVYHIETELTPVQNKSISRKPKNIYEEMRDFADEAIRRGINMVESYNDWFKIACALRYELGEDGRQIYHDLSRMSSKYSYKDADEEYSKTAIYNYNRAKRDAFFNAMKSFGITTKVVYPYIQEPFYNQGVNTVNQTAIATQPEVQNEETYIDALLDERTFKMGDKPEELDFCLRVTVNKLASVEGGPRDLKTYDVGGFGMLGIITGIEKSRKSTFLSALVASGLSGGEDRIGVTMDLQGKEAIFVDTEQSEQFFYRTQERAHYLAGYAEDHPMYRAVCMRDFTVEQRIKGIERLLERTSNLGLLVIDGALDLVRSFNDEAECQAIVQRIMNWTKQSGAMILTVIHKNRSSDWMQGHLGSMLEKKCDFSFEMTHRDTDGFTTISNRHSRTAPFPSYEFTQDSNGYPVLNHLAENAVKLPVAINSQSVKLVKAASNQMEDPLGEFEPIPQTDWEAARKRIIEDGDDFPDDTPF